MSGADVVAHGVAEEQVRGVVAEGVGVGVAGDAVGGNECAGESELGSLAGGEGRNWRWISAARLTPVARWPHW